MRSVSQGALVVWEVNSVTCAAYETHSEGLLCHIAGPERMVFTDEQI